MASLDSLPADQKAVLSLVLQRGQSFDQIAALLFIDREAVRQRALQGLEALGPETSVDSLERGLITDYLLSQLSPATAEDVYNSLASNPPERAWARVIAAEIAPLAVNPLPEIPAAAATAISSAAAETPPVSPAPASATGASTAPGIPSAISQGGATPVEAAPTAPRPAASSIPPSSRRGGAMLLGLIAVVVIAVVVVLIVTGGSSKKKTQTNARATTAPPIASTTGTSTTVTPLHQINLTSPTNTKAREGAADVVRANGKIGIVIVAEGLAANTKNAYGVWLYNSKTGSGDFLGFDGQQVTGTGKTKGELEVENALPTNATQYNELLLTLESVEKPTHPGTIILQGTFAE